MVLVVLWTPFAIKKRMIIEFLPLFFSLVYLKQCKIKYKTNYGCFIISHCESVVLSISILRNAGSCTDNTMATTTKLSRLHRDRQGRLWQWITRPQTIPLESNYVMLSMCTICMQNWETMNLNSIFIRDYVVGWDARLDVCLWKPTPAFDFLLCSRYFTAE